MISNDSGLGTYDLGTSGRGCGAEQQEYYIRKYFNMFWPLALVSFLKRPFRSYAALGGVVSTLSSAFPLL